MRDFLQNFMLQEHRAARIRAGNRARILATGTSVLGFINFEGHFWSISRPFLQISECSEIPKDFSEITYLRHYLREYFWEISWNLRDVSWNLEICGNGREML